MRNMLLSVLFSKSSLLSSFGTLLAAVVGSEPFLLRLLMPSVCTACTAGFGVVFADGRSWLNGFSGCGILSELAALTADIFEMLGEEAGVEEFEGVEGVLEAFCCSVVLEVEEPDNFARRLFRICSWYMSANTSNIVAEVKVYLIHLLLVWSVRLRRRAIVIHSYSPFTALCEVGMLSI